MSKHHRANNESKEDYRLADIAMCNANNCPIKNKCHRYTAPVNQYMQSYITPETIGEQCNFFWNNKGYREEKGK